MSSDLGEPSPCCDIAQVHSTHTAIITYDDLIFVLLSTGGLVCVCVCADVGFKLGANVGVKSLVLQLHYGDLTKPGQADTSALTLTVTKRR